MLGATTVRVVFFVMTFFLFNGQIIKLSDSLMFRHLHITDLDLQNLASITQPHCLRSCPRTSFVVGETHNFQYRMFVEHTQLLLLLKDDMRSQQLFHNRSLWVLPATSHASLVVRTWSPRYHVFLESIMTFVIETKRLPKLHIVKGSIGDFLFLLFWIRLLRKHRHHVTMLRDKITLMNTTAYAICLITNIAIA